MSDALLAALRRRVELAPEDGALRLELCAALLRAGARDEALAALWRARASGVEASEAAPLARALEAPPSPWALAWGGDPATPGTSRLSGPRRGEVVARTPLEAARDWFLLVLADGTVLLGTGDKRVRAYDGRTLAPRGEWTTLEGWQRGYVAREEGGFGYAAHGHLVAHPAPGELRTWPSPRATQALLLPLAGAGHLLLEGRHVVVHGPDGALLREEELDLRWNPAWIAAAALRGEELGLAVRVEEELWFAWVDLAASPPAIRLPRITLPLAESRDAIVSRLVAGPDRLLLAVAAFDAFEREYSYRLHAIGPAGELWSVPAGTIEALGPAPSIGVALGPEAHTWLADLDALRRLDAQGNAVWSLPIGPGAWWTAGLVLDREGVAYVQAAGGLTAFDPDGRELFRVPGAYRPWAIDARGRLLAVRADSRRLHELVAIE